MSDGPLSTLKIENVVASTKLNDSLDLVKIAEKIPGADYNKKRFPGVVLRMTDPKIAALVFGSGKVVLTGAKSLDTLAVGVDNLVRIMKDIGVRINENPGYSVQNIVTSADLGCHINLNKIAMSLSLDKIEYEPEQFPGLVYRLDEPKVVVLLFGSGKLIITGGKVKKDAERAVERIYNDLAALKLV
ncbi:MAG TPA: TATA-box-binding protein [Methanocorpusculum sp.]|nr:TATA-box-binding protein [Methanocorpusculum sp.]